MEKPMTKTIMLLDGDSEHTLAIAAELKNIANVKLITVGSSERSRALRSRYADIRVVLPHPRSSDFPRKLLESIANYQPDLVIPVTFASVMAVDSIRADLNESVHLALPSQQSLHLAVSKEQTLALANKLGIRVPKDFTASFRAGVDPQELPYPLFLKIAEEVGANVTSLVKAPEDLSATYERLTAMGYGDNILVQEYIDGDPYTYGCALLYLNGQVQLCFQHQEVRSVPRNGGAGTRLRYHNDPKLLELSRSLLDALSWNGPALVEYKKNASGEYVLMEINPKYWASYALASQNGFHFAAVTAANLIGREYEAPAQPNSVREMVFPLRELAYAIRNRRRQSVFASIRALVSPPARTNILLSDLFAYIDPRWFARLFRRR